MEGNKCDEFFLKNQHKSEDLWELVVLLNI